MLNIINGIKYWGQAFLIPLYLFSFLTPRSKKIWLFGSSFGYSLVGNPKHFYLYVNQYQSKSIRPIWISRNREIVSLVKKNGYEAYYAKSLKGIYYCLHGAVYIFDNYSKDISFWLSGGAKKMNLWHGIALKKINYDNQFDMVRHPKNKWEKFKTYLRRMSDEKPHHYTLSTSDIMAGIFVSSFQTTRDHILVCGYPRNDILFDNNRWNIFSVKESDCLIRINKYLDSGNKIVFYVPTFRPTETMFFEIMDLEIFNQFLRNHNLVFLIKLHPKSKLKDKFMKMEYSSIINIDMEIDIHSFLKYIDILITDYSSIYFDYLMCNKPMIFFPYDYDEYLRDTREFNFDYDEYTPGLKVCDMDELMSGIVDAFAYDKYSEHRIKIKAKMFENVDDLASWRLFEAVVTVLSQ